jgi:hypothetical protein
MSSLLELVIDLINDAKNAKDAQNKLYLLEQVKEIAFHRDKTLLKEVLPIIVDFMIEKSAPVRKFLVKFVEEAMGQDSQFTFPYFLNLLNFLVNDSNDFVLASLAASFHKNYVSLIMNVVGMPNVTKAQGLNDPKQLWQIITALTKKFNDFISSSRHDYLKIQCLRLYEIELMFGLPGMGITTVDPRLARKAADPRLAARNAASGASSAGSGAATGTSGGSGSGGGGAGAKTAEDISLHHPFISRTEIQNLAEENMTRALLWASKGGPHGYSFSPTLMSLLGQVIANVSATKLKHATSVALALVALVQGKGNLSQEMNNLDRQQLARAVHALLRAASAHHAAAADSEGALPKLRAAVGALEALGVDTTTAAAATTTSAAGAGGRGGRKRGRDSAPDVVADEEDSEEFLAQRRATAIAAVDAAESKMTKTGNKGAAASAAAATGLEGLFDENDEIAMLLGEVSAENAAAAAGKLGGSSSSGGGGGGIAGALGNRLGGAGAGGVLTLGDTTELAKDLPGLESEPAVQELRLVTTTQTACSSSSSSGGKGGKGSSSNSAAEAAAAVSVGGLNTAMGAPASSSSSYITTLTPIAQSSEGYADLALTALKKLLEGYAVLETNNPTVSSWA